MEEHKEKPFGADFWTFVISRSYMIIHITTWFIFAVSLFHFIINYGKLPDEAGVHFAGNGQFDVYDSKVYGFYPFIVSFVALILTYLFERAAGSKKVKLGMKLNEKGETLFRGTIVLGLAVEGFLITMVFAYYWARSVEQQIPLPVHSELKGVLIAAFFVVPLTALILLIAIGIIFRDKAKKE